MSPTCAPASAEDLAGELRAAADAGHSIALYGNNSKQSMGGPALACDVRISTARLSRVLRYEPNDLTISVETGMRWTELQRILAGNGQMIALDPPFAAHATVGGVIASNTSGPLRARFGTARDLVIGMQFAMLDGKVVTTGGMVVKNVAGLDIGKLLIGSFGTLAAIVSVNLRLQPLPEQTATFLFSFSDSDAALERASKLRESSLRPIACDLLGPVVAARLGFRGYLVAVCGAGSRRILERYARELKSAEQLPFEVGQNFWRQVREFPADYLDRHSAGVILRISTPLADTGSLLRMTSGACSSHVNVGVSHVYLSGWRSVRTLWRAAAERGWNAVVEYAPQAIRSEQELWLLDAQHTEAFAIMKSVKQMFDPQNLLNPMRLYGRI